MINLDTFVAYFAEVAEGAICDSLNQPQESGQHGLHMKTTLPISTLSAHCRATQNQPYICSDMVGSKYQTRAGAVQSYALPKAVMERAMFN